MAKRLFLLLLATATFSVPQIAWPQSQPEKPATQESVVSFNREIRPILSDKCYACHGPDEAARESGIRLDVADEADLDEVIARITSDDPDLIMPPPESEKTISKKEVALVKEWISQGANYEKHWAFIAPQRPTPPKQTAKSIEKESVTLDNPDLSRWPQSPIDQFVFKKMVSNGLRPSERADRQTLITRASLDLVGLPPTPEEVRAFVNDSSENAYERVVDRLLASPHYGERQALNWLDHARYADSNGYQSDGSRTLWPWRDWVINAYNRNLPFDQFTIEQLAGDMLAEPTREQIIATGFNRNHRLNGEGGRIVDEWFVETVIDRVETTGLTWMGLTFNCCRCHDHKYDPISQKEFYQMFAFFNSVEESGVLAPAGKNGENTPPLLALTTPDQEKRIADLEKTIADDRKSIEALNKKLPVLIADWEANLKRADRRFSTKWSLPSSSSSVSLKGAALTPQKDGTIFARRDNPPNDIYQIVFEPDDLKSASFEDGKITAVQLTVFPDKRLPGKSLGRGSNGNFVLTGFELELVNANQKPGEKTQGTQVQFDSALADFEQAGWNVASVIKPPKSGNRGWAIAGFDNKNKVQREAIFKLKSPVDISGKAIRITMRHDSPFADHNVGRFQIGFTNDAPKQIRLKDGNELPANIGSVLEVDSTKRDAKQIKQLQEYFKQKVPSEYKEAVTKLAASKKSLKDYRNSIPVTMVMKEKPSARDAFILERGEYDKPQAKVERGLPSVLPGLPDDQPLDRLGLARWIASESNPLTARVWVNRQWEKFFGRGIVKSTENFGSQADFPTHPELLDWLAVEFVSPKHAPEVNGTPAQKWDMKAFHKMLVMSETYCQSSNVDKVTLEKDPENIWLSRGPRFRLAGELIRDRALSAGGLLVNTIGGPSVRPYMPEGVWDETTRYGNLRNYKHTTDDGLYRRTMYTIWKRTAAPPTMLLFDAPNRETCTIKRSRTNTPLQALSLLNEVTFVEAARGLANRMIREGGDSAESRIRLGFEIAIGRLPSQRELSVLGNAVEEDLAYFADNIDSAEKLIGFGETSFSDIPQDELAAYTLVGNVILNLDEFVTRK